MKIFRFNNKIVFNKGKIIKDFIPSETPALNKLQQYWTAMNMFIVDYDRIPTNQTELSSYMNFDSTTYYNFSYFFVNTGLSYFQATSENNRIHSYTRTTSWNGSSLNEIICKKMGTTAPGVADYTGGTLSCQTGTIEV